MTLSPAAFVFASSNDIAVPLARVTVVCFGELHVSHTSSCGDPIGSCKTPSAGGGPIRSLQAITIRTSEPVTSAMWCSQGRVEAPLKDVVVDDDRIGQCSVAGALFDRADVDEQRASAR